MNILVIGASSQVGTELSIAFAQNNHLILLGRNISKLESLKQECLQNNATNISILNKDIVSDLEVIKQELNKTPIDLIINVASATSQLRDSDIIELEQIDNYIATDVTSPIHIIRHCMTKNKNIEIIFISTVLTLVKSPNRNLYSSLKIVEETLLHRLKQLNPSMNLLIVKVGKVIRTDKSTDKSKGLAQKVLNAYKDKKKMILYGLSGYLYIFLFYLQPLLFFAILKLQRSLRKKNPTQ